MVQQLNTQYADIPRSALAGAQAGTLMQRNALLQNEETRKQQESDSKQAEAAQQEAALYFYGLHDLPEEKRATEYPVVAKVLKQRHPKMFDMIPDEYTPEVGQRINADVGALKAAAALKREPRETWKELGRDPLSQQMIMESSTGDRKAVGSGPQQPYQPDPEKPTYDRSGKLLIPAEPSPAKQIANYEAWTKLAAVQGTPIDNDVAVLFKLPGAMTPTDAITKIAEAKNAKTRVEKTSILEGIMAELPSFQSSGLSAGQKMDPKMKQEALDAYDRLITHLETFAGGAQPKATQGGGVDASSFVGKQPGTYRSKSGKRVKWDGVTATPLGD